MNLPIFLMMFVISLVLVLLVINQLVSVNNPNAEKLSPYECGFSPLGDTRGKFSIQFYIVAILFLVFDLEVAFLLPSAVSLYLASFYGFWVLFLFLVILTIGLVYEIAKGALKFHTNPKTSNLPQPQRAPSPPPPCRFL
jgi:NADH-quinone oxidoreductase subunit A